MAYTSTPARKLSSAAIIQKWMTEAVADGGRDHYSGKRKNPRIEWFAPVMLVVSPGQPGERTYFAQCRDISKKGLGVRSPESIPERTIVRVYVNDGEDFVAGRVKHTSSTVGAYALGIEFLPEPG